MGLLFSSAAVTTTNTTTTTSSTTSTTICYKRFSTKILPNINTETSNSPTHLKSSPFLIVPFFRNATRSIFRKRKERVKERVAQRLQKKQEDTEDKDTSLFRETKQEQPELLVDERLRTWNFTDWDEDDGESSLYRIPPRKTKLVFVWDVEGEDEKNRMVKTHHQQKQNKMQELEQELEQEQEQEQEQAIRDMVDNDIKRTPPSVPFLEKERLQRREKIYARNILMEYYHQVRVDRWKQQLIKIRYMEAANIEAQRKVHKSSANLQFIQTLTKAMTDEEAHAKQDLHERPWGS